jgi:DNA repair protein RadC
MKLSDLTHRVDRPREKLEKLGASALKDDELLALLLRTGYQGKNVLELSREVLRKLPSGSLRKAAFADLKAMKGVGASRAATLVAAFELAGRLSDEPLEPVLDTPQKAAEKLSWMRGKKQEHFAALYLNARHQALRQETIFIGTLSSSLVHPREVFAPALETRSAAIIVAHNHPSGDPRPSAEDREATRRLRRAGELLGIELLDHLVIAQQGIFSFREQGWP